MALTLEERMANSSERNQSFFNDYFEFQEKVLDVDSLKQYRSTLVRLHEFINHQDIDTIKLEQIREYLFQEHNIRTFTSKLYHIKSYFSYLDDVTELSFELDALQQLTFPSEKGKNVDKREAEPLSIEELVMLRNKLKRNKDYKKLFTLEMLYNYGLTPAEVSQCNTDSYNEEEKTFKLENKTIKVNERIQNLVSSKGVLDSVSQSTIVYRLSGIGSLLNRSLTPTDITKTRELNFFTCPSCRMKYENNPKYWSIIEYNIDYSKWMVCKYCAKGDYIE